MEKTDTQGSCTYKQGSLPECAPLALAQIPAQKSSEPAYKSGEALSRGTLFPGLDLPFKNIVNQMPVETTELRELMALGFVTEELGLYLDTHASDTQAFETFKSFLKLYEEGRKEYVARFGPLSLSDLSTAKSFTWLNDPWPWEYSEVKEG